MIMLRINIKPPRFYVITDSVKRKAQRSFSAKTFKMLTVNIETTIKYLITFFFFNNKNVGMMESFDLVIFAV